MWDYANPARRSTGYCNRHDVSGPCPCPCCRRRKPVERNRQFRWRARNVPRVRRQWFINPRQYPGVRPAATVTAKRPKNQPSVPIRQGCRLRQPVWFRRVGQPTQQYPGMYDLSGNRQTSEEFTVATTQPRGVAVTALPVCTLPTSPTTASWCLRLGRQPPNVRRIHRRYHNCQWVGGYRNPCGCRPVQHQILVYDLSGNRQTAEEFTVATTFPTGVSVTATRVYIGVPAHTDGILVYDER